MYRVKEAFYTLQGEGAQAGRAAVFCRFSKCNLWNGRESDRANAVCSFCDTDFVGTDGQNGGQFADAAALADHVAALWPADTGASDRVKPYVVCTGGEPLLQLDTPLIEAFHQRGFEVGVETNGTLPAPAGLDWLCVSPKADAKVVIERCDELKLVYPQPLAMPERFTDMQAQHFFLSPMASPAIPEQSADPVKQSNTRKATDYCLAHPQWRLTLQMHKIIGID
ncbi:MAG: 7-carboxy-7-deazaguanine synthase [Alteromonadaceae bacterium]|uniref:7-carboxy-7-deazaguanine synthase n=1 Tax=Marinobacter sp. BGYM27 TaxID=2975597 RepID=UPI000C5DE24D|nr:7-carboxy-7-deazaguanine synthase [Marinobacter sp. BGYM27]MAA65404.1 7-carboxy-7-deazaguanine synthase [Alteromonadaceae bacterium]MBH85070.1 7-carboxy-7-deazaguanine synthase [Alteromonadaceae bacterium]MDG5500137.1 7-carboxy-7-deazaguanine synthase [Marinobacter sp. BGYM27]|tara:strand:- start:35161 stop:35832 length:672 start_codon:yes stop_codon:yes gene_type:complete